MYCVCVQRPAGVDEDDSIVVLNHKGDLACGATLEEEKMYLIIGMCYRREKVYKHKQERDKSVMPRIGIRY